MPMKRAPDDGAERVPGRFATAEASIEEDLEKYSYGDRVIEEVTRLGIHELPQPQFEEDHLSIFRGVKDSKGRPVQVGTFYEGQIPSIVKNYSLDEITVLYMLAEHWLNFLTYQSMVAKLRKAEAGKKLAYLEVRLRKKAEQKYDKKTDQLIRDEARINPLYVEQDAKYEELKMTSDLVETAVKIAIRNMNAISREVTARVAKLEVKGRADATHSKITDIARRRAQLQQQAAQAEEEMPNAEGDETEPAAESAAPPRKATRPSYDYRKG